MPLLEDAEVKPFEEYYSSKGFVFDEDFTDSSKRAYLLKIKSQVACTGEMCYTMVYE